MNDNVVNYIIAQLSANISISIIYEQLAKQGFSQQQIDQNFQIALQRRNTNIPVGKSPVSQTEEPVKKSFDITKAFVVIGSILIVAAIVIAIVSKWYDVGPTGKILFMVIPMLALFGLSALLNNKEGYKEVGNITLGLGSFILPFAIGTILCQTKVFDEINPLLILTCALSSLPIYLLFEFLLKKYYTGIFTVIAIFVAYFAFSVKIEMDMLPMIWFATLVAFIITLVGFLLAIIKKENSTIYIALGTFALIAMLPSSTILTIAKNDPTSSLPYDLYFLIVSGYGFVYMVLASVYYYFFKSLNHKGLYSIKRVIEEISPLIILIPILALGATASDKSGYLYLALVISIAFVLISARILISSILYFGSLGIIACVLLIAGQIFKSDFAFILVVMITGFLAIGIGLLIRYLIKERKEAANNPVILGLGRDPTVPVAKISILRIIIIIILIIFILPSAASYLLFSGIGRYKSNNSSPTSDMKTEEFKETTSGEVVPDTTSTEDAPTTTITITPR